METRKLNIKIENNEAIDFNLNEIEGFKQSIITNKADILVTDGAETFRMHTNMKMSEIIDLLSKNNIQYHLYKIDEEYENLTRFEEDDDFDYNQTGYLITIPR